MPMGEKKIPKKMLHTKMVGELSRGRSRTRWIDQIRKEMGKLGRNIRKQEMGELKWLEISL